MRRFSICSSGTLKRWRARRLQLRDRRERARRDQQFACRCGGCDRGPRAWARRPRRRRPGKGTPPRRSGALAGRACSYRLPEATRTQPRSTAAASPLDRAAPLLAASAPDEHLLSQPGRPEGCQYWCRAQAAVRLYSWMRPPRRSRRRTSPPVGVDAGGGCRGCGGRRLSARCGLRVVVLDVDAEDALEVAAVEDEQPVEAFAAGGSNEALGDGVCLRRPHRRLDDADASAAEHLVEGAGVLAVAVADHEAHALVRQIPADVARLLGGPGPGRVGRAAGQPDASAFVRDEEQDVVAAQEHALDGEEVAGDDARRLGAQELAPTRT